MNKATPTSFLFIRKERVHLEMTSELTPHREWESLIVPHLLFLSLLAYHHLYDCRALLISLQITCCNQEFTQICRNRFGFVLFFFFFLLLLQNTFNQEIVYLVFPCVCLQLMTKKINKNHLTTCIVFYLPTNSELCVHLWPPWRTSGLWNTILLL